MSYLTYWRLSRSPFSLSHPTRDFFLSGVIADALTRAEFLVQHGRRLGLLFGPRGVGKTSFFKYFIGRCARFPKQIPGLIDMSGSTPELLARRFHEFLSGVPTFDRWSTANRTADNSWFGDGLGTASFGRTLQEIDEIIAANNTVGRQPIVFLDNAEEASEEVLQTLGILLRRPGHWSAVLSVDESLLVNIPRKILEDCDIRIDLPVWDLGLTAEYIETFLAKCGKREDVFTAQGITRIHELGDGIPKRMFQIAESALIVGAEKQVESVDADLVDQICEDFSVGLVPRGFCSTGFSDR